MEWTSHMLFLEATIASNHIYESDTLFNETQSEFTNLLNQRLWHPSDNTPEEHTLVMVAKHQQQDKKSTTSNKGKASSKSGTKRPDRDNKAPAFVTEFCPICSNEQFQSLAFILDAQTVKKTIKLEIAANGKTYKLL